MAITHDRGAIIDFIGRRHGSPGIKKVTGEPVILIGPDDPGAMRVGWPGFFAAVERGKLALEFDEASGAHRWILRKRAS